MCIKQGIYILRKNISSYAKLRHFIYIYIYKLNYFAVHLKQLTQHGKLTILQFKKWFKKAAVTTKET